MRPIHVVRALAPAGGGRVRVRCNRCWRKARYDEATAYAAAALHPETRQHGRGLGDRSCMALGLALGLPVLTAGCEWRHVEVEGLTIEMLR